MTAFAMQQPGRQPKERIAPARARRSAPAGTRHEARRRCIVTGEVRPQSELLRFVVAPDGTLFPDIAGKLPGRGMWLTPSRSALDKACARNLFARAARCAVRLPDDLAAQVSAALERRCLELIGLAKRAGLVAAGFEKCKAQLAAGRAGLLLQAADAADDGRDRLAALGTAARPGLLLFRLLAAADLGRALGRSHAVHVALKPAPLTERLAADLGRLQQWCAGDDNQDGGATDPLLRRRT